MAMTRFQASKETVQAMLERLHKNANRLSSDDYDALYTFIKACIPRLPKQETIAKYTARSRRAK